MVDPVIALLSFGLLALILALLLWPKRGIASRLLRLSRMTERVRLEDTLKHLYKCEYAGRDCSVDSVAGSVGVPRGRAIHLLGRLEEQGFALAVREGFVLTEEGRDYALHIVRTHRLLERYLADRTGVLPEDWHGEAERREHMLSPEERESLAAKLGHPLYDPHGDPIPTATGDLPPLTGVPLSALGVGDVASIVHLGDEPFRLLVHQLPSCGHPRPPHLEPPVHESIRAGDQGNNDHERGEGGQDTLPTEPRGTILGLPDEVGNAVHQRFHKKRDQLDNHGNEGDEAFNDDHG